MTMLNKNRPEHRNPEEHQHIASAPYNFVPLPEKIIPDISDASDLPDHDRYYPEPNYHSGYFDVTLTTVSPLYIRGPIGATDLPRQEEKGVKDNPAFFHTGDETRPVIPGSSLRGMLRALLEIVSYSKMKWVSEKKFFFRTVDGSAIGQHYNRRMVKDLGTLYPAHPRARVYRALVEGGFFRVRENGTCFIEKCTVARVETLDLLWLFRLRESYDLYEIDGRAVTTREDKLDPNQTPRWLYQHREIWAAIDEAEKDEFFPEKRTRNGKIRHPDLYLSLQRAHNLALTSAKGKKQGKLVLTGHMNHKHMAFLFVPFEQPAPRIEIPNDPAEQNLNKRLLDRFHDDDQLTQWQKKAFPANRQPTGPKNAGHLLDGDPVFFLRNEKGELVFFGRAQMFRLPYEHSPFDLVDPALHSTIDIDYAEALFGFVRTRDELKELEKLEKDGKKIPQGDKRRAYAGRVIVTDAVLKSDRADAWEAFHPRILATPKPTAFQHYLTQQHPDDKRKLDHYDSRPPASDETTIRGHKLYWHQGLGLDTEQNLTLEQILDAIEEEPGKVPEDDTQHTCLKPLKPGVQFSFRVYFENLSDRELGALCWTLHPRGEPDRRYCHHLGMGKPLGMGAVELHARLHLINRSQRYETLFSDSGDSWQLGNANAEGEDLAVPDVLASRTHLFEEHLLEQLSPDQPRTRLADMRRMAMLLKLLEWPGYRAEKEGDLYLEAEGRPNTRYMELGEYRDRPVLPDPTLFDAAYFENKSRPQGTPTPQSQAHEVDQQDGKSETSSQAATVEQAPAEKDGDLPVLPSEWAWAIYIGNELRGMSNFTQGEQGVEVRFWDWNPAQIIGFIPIGLVGRPLDQRISVIITGLHQEPGGRIVVELKLRPKR